MQADDAEPPLLQSTIQAAEASSPVSQQREAHALPFRWRQ